MADEDMLRRWMAVLVDYAVDWDRTFESRPDYFTQEYWYLFAGCLTHHWNGAPLTVSAACQVMKSGSNRTREDRIKRAVMDGYLEKRKGGDDGRTLYVVPTPRLEALMRGHLLRTLDNARKALA